MGGITTLHTREYLWGEPIIRSCWVPHNSSIEMWVRKMMGPTS